MLLDDQYLIPLNPIALLLFDPDVISQKINIIKSGESYVISLKIKITNHNNQERDYVIQKEYGKNDVIVKEPPSANAIWPDFAHPNWNTYFLYNAATLQSNILVILESSNLINLDNLILKKQYKNKNLFFFRT